MKCEICHLNNATTAIHSNTDGSVKELFVCESCARLSPGAINPAPSADGTVPPVASLTDILFSIGVAPPGMKLPTEKIDDGVCPKCGMSRGEVRARHRMGCAMCYDVFAKDAGMFVAEQQETDPEPGAFLGENKAEREIAALRDDLAKAVEEERFEDAAALRDKIKTLTDKLFKDDDDAPF